MTVKEKQQSETRDCPLTILFSAKMEEIAKKIRGEKKDQM
jgi:hypothetical protein